MAEYMRARRARLLAARRCQDCTAALLPEWGRHCPECHGKRRLATRTRERKAMRRAAYRAQKAASMRASRSKAPDVFRRRVVEWRESMVAAGLCRDCGRCDAAPGVRRCQSCREKHNERARRKGAANVAPR